MSVLLVATLSIILFACNGDEPDFKGESGNVSKETLAQIKETFPGMRLDSIHYYHDDDDGLVVCRVDELEYDGPLLIAYRNMDEGSAIYVKYSQDTVYIKRYGEKYTAILGKNGLVESVMLSLNSDTIINYYKYNSENQLIRFGTRTRPIDVSCHCEITWNNGNVSKVKEFYYENYDLGNSAITQGKLRWVETTYSYTSDLNTGAIQPSYYYSWLQARKIAGGKSFVINEVNRVLYYAGLLGRGTKNLVKGHSILYYDGVTSEGEERFVWNPDNHRLSELERFGEDFYHQRDYFFSKK